MLINIGIAQTPNSLDLKKNFESITALLARFENSAADLVLFPECCLSGFSAKMKDCTAELLRPYLEHIQSWTNRTGIEVALPTAIVKKGLTYNSGYWFKKNQALSFYKHGLTESELKFFSAPIEPTAKVFTTNGFRFALLICFEVEQSPWTYFQSDEVDAILWPGYWGWTLESRWRSEKELGDANLIYSNMKHWQRPLLQANFAFNDLGKHKGDGPEGLSFIINADNHLFYRGAHKQVTGFLATLQKTAGKTTVTHCVPL